MCRSAPSIRCISVTSAAPPRGTGARRRFDYAALLQVNAIGFVEQYPNLWEAEP
jgi:hypothetical protein